VPDEGLSSLAYKAMHAAMIADLAGEHDLNDALLHHSATLLSASFARTLNTPNLINFGLLTFTPIEHLARVLDVKQTESVEKFLTESPWVHECLEQIYHQIVP
jgi:hypothetical protein